MSDTKIKICGLMREQDINLVNIFKPDFIGFVFAARRHRYITPGLAADLRMKLSPCIIPIGVFVNEPVENVANLLRDGIISMAQLHGRESEEYIVSLQHLTGRPVIKAFMIKNFDDIRRATQSPADFILLDNGTGGTGRAFDWTLVQDIGRPFFLAGGLNAENVTTAIGLTHPYAVDTSSGVETDNIKDSDKIQKFINVVRGR